MMDTFISAAELAALTPENLLTVFYSLLICQKSANHGDESFPVNGWQPIDLFSDKANIGQGFVSGAWDDQTSEYTDVSMRKAG